MGSQNSFFQNTSTIVAKETLPYPKYLVFQIDTSLTSLFFYSVSLYSTDYIQ